MNLASPGVFTIAARRKRRSRLLSFFVRMWLLPARSRRTLPVPVNENRFDAPLCRFFFGIIAPVSTRLFRRENHRELFAFEFRRGFDLCYIRERFGNARDHLMSQLRVRDLPSPKHECHLHFVALAQKPARMTS